jgi:hypothetical protein
LLQSTATEIGVAVARAPDRDPKFISVQMLGRPEALKVTFKIENRSGATVRYRFGTETEDLPPRTIATLSDCGMDKLSFDKLPAAQTGFEPHDGDRFLLSSPSADAIKVDVERK